MLSKKCGAYGALKGVERKKETGFFKNQICCCSASRVVLAGG
jgi:hypothetical protein